MRDQKIGDGHECSLSVFHVRGAAALTSKRQRIEAIDGSAVVGGDAVQLLAAVVGAFAKPILPLPTEARR
jgi:hypothetical protein